MLQKKRSLPSGECCAKKDLRATVEAIIPPQGEGAHWLVLIAIAPAAFLKAFFSEAGKDAWHGLKRLLHDLRAARGGDRAGSGDIVARADTPSRDDSDAVEHVAALLGWVEPPDAIITLSLSADLPDEALQALFELDLSEYGADYLFWDKERRQWRTPSPTDEENPTDSE